MQKNILTTFHQPKVLCHSMALHLGPVYVLLFLGVHPTYLNLAQMSGLFNAD